MSRASRQGRDAAGRYYPGKALRLKAHFRCKNCGRDLFQREVRLMQSGPLRGDLAHRQVPGPWCGAVVVAPNPRYRQA